MRTNKKLDDFQLTLLHLEKLDKNEYVINQTRKYIAQALKVYGKEFRDNVRKIHSVAVAIDDLDYRLRSSTNYNYHIYSLFLVNSAIHGGSETFGEFLTWVRNETSAYQTDYPFDDPLKGNFHMVVFKLPIEFKPSMEMFRRSKYSSMYIQKDIEKLYAETKGSSEYKTLIKDDARRIEFETQVNNLSKDKAVTSTWINIPEEVEYDFKCIWSEEVFNYYQVGQLKPELKNELFPE